jgi:hypothetical protein
MDGEKVFRFFALESTLKVNTNWLEKFVGDVIRARENSYLQQSPKKKCDAIEQR